MKILNKNEILAAQIQQHQAYITYWQTVILSGANTKRIKEIQSSDLQMDTEEELVNDALTTMQNHCNRIAELVEAMDRNFSEI